MLKNVLNLWLTVFKEFELEYRKLLKTPQLKIIESLKCVLTGNGLKINPGRNYMSDIKPSSLLFTHQLGETTKVQYFAYFFIFLIFLIRTFVK